MLWVIIYSFKGLVLCVVLVCGQILVTFTQILSKVATIYPVQLPSVFTSFWGNFNVLSFDLSTLPLNCVFDSNEATVHGGAVMGGHLMEFYNCDFLDNSAKFAGGKREASSPLHSHHGVLAARISNRH